MEKLNFPVFSLHIKSRENKNFIFDLVRKKWLVLTPEEWVRQNCINYLINEKGYPLGLIQVEKKLKVNKLEKRYDIVVFNKEGAINLLVECKRTNIPITQKTFDQIAQYNFTLNSKNLMITNGLDHIYFKIDQISKKYTFVKEFPLK